MALTAADEYRALHEDALWVDRTARDARIDVRGPDAADWLQGLLTQDVKALQDGQGAHAAYLTPQGRMVADLRVFRRSDGFLLETVADAREALLSRLDQFVIMEDVTVADASDTLGCLTVLGPAAAAAVAACAGLDAATLSALPEHAHLSLPSTGGLVASTREFGVPGFDLFGPIAEVEGWRGCLQGRVPRGGDEVLDTARIEAGRPRFGVDMHEDTIPLEAGIQDRAISFTKGCYVGQEVVIRILHRGHGRVARRLVWLEQAPHGPDAPDWTPGATVHLGEQAVGALTSACWSPSRGGLLAIAMVHRDAAEPGTTVSVGAREAIVRRLP